ncbi:hypothetical protein HYQ45_010069 [Verticillium longisporum]|uniref:Uncharacterized protein n=1 Tax=Verticillium longisporum TaxID=100787 RepID=A0A8I3APS0_VERLO|nr:hypothetical protein HYQ45_010069 [Verticillium longisporum]
MASIKRFLVKLDRPMRHDHRLFQRAPSTALADTNLFVFMLNALNGTVNHHWNSGVYLSSLAIPVTKPGPW